MREITAPAGVAATATVPRIPFGPVDGPAWEGDARCRAEDPALFFGPNRFEPKHERLTREARAKSICEQCPAMVACREHALAAAEPYGVWGGLGESDRRSVLAANAARVARSA